MLSDGVLDADESAELLETLRGFAASLLPSRNQATMPLLHRMFFRSTTQRQSLSGQVTSTFLRA